MKRVLFIAVLFILFFQVGGIAQSDNRWEMRSSWGDQRDGTYLNPIIPADYSDIDCIRVGDDYYAITSTFQFSPGMTVIHSTDLVNWEICGHAVDDLTQIGPKLNWTQMDRYGRGIWAGTIRYHEGRFYVFFGTPDEGFFMTSAPRPEGPWEPLHQLMDEPGWDDCSVFWDEDGTACFVGTHFADNYKTYFFKMTPDGKTIDRSSAMLVNEGAGREASKLIKVGDWYYLIFSEHFSDKGRYVVARRAKSLWGPYSEIKQLAHPGREAKEPNQGGIVLGHDGNWYFLTHHGTGTWEGRVLSLLPVTWVDEWPIIGQVGLDGMGNMVWEGKIPGVNKLGNTLMTSDQFDGINISKQWQWNYQPRTDMFSLEERPGWLRLKAFKPLRQNQLLSAGNTLTQRSYRSAGNEVIVKMDISAMTDGQKNGLCHFSKEHASIGVAQADGIRRLEYRQNDKVITGEIITTPTIWLKSVWGLDGKSHFSYSVDGKTFREYGDPYQLKWGNYRGDRIGLFCFNDDSESGVVDIDFLEYNVSDTPLR
ncbi:beta-xylosidase [Parabacteroides sp. PFB2-10]|uniref:glycoside hydrolase family 43 protein n=1 Tax=Parabacteroides sp. PFB2-10 TaxID=1742405 RepID=UPI002476D542|nr:glycoside hydrolase 43 family protein [Parabacteroides sp. PFB2-10]MDH6312399.1 beta-xylosidase [Parabacteroides sp. PFB2-10]